MVWVAGRERGMKEEEEVGGAEGGVWATEGEEDWERGRGGGVL